MWAALAFTEVETTCVLLLLTTIHTCDCCWLANEGGGAWNHALYFKHLAPSGSAHADPSKSLSGELAAAIDKSFGSLKKMQDAVSQAGKDVFGSGWAWLCYTGKKVGKLV